MLSGYFVLGRRSPLASALFLGLASIFFYGWWNPRYVPLLLVSIGANFTAGTVTSRAVTRGDMRTAFAATTLGICFDLILLGYYKYANFFVDNADLLTGAHWSIATIVLPLGISFFTFTQIAFLVDTYKGIAREYNFVHYMLFVTYFPHLIAGPILHHKEMMPQFTVASTYQPHAEHFAVGLTLFFIGLCKKVAIADNLAVYVAPVFDAAANGESLSFIDAWGGALAYTMQLYFDFSGYSDMAIGLSRMFGIKLPVNFNSPYKAINIIDFWRRWHITLSRFLRDYLYFPLGGNRRGQLRRYTNLIVTMLIGGLWHGAGWTFVVWGALHGCFLAINHAWQAIRSRWRGSTRASSGLERSVGVVITFLSVVAAWVVFRAASLEGALVQLRAMTGLDGVILPRQLAELLPGVFISALNQIGVGFGDIGRLFAGADQLVWIALTLAGCWILPNSQELLAKFHPVLQPTKEPTSGIRLMWQPNLQWSAFTAGIAVVSFLHMNRVSEFLYFQF